MSVVLSIEEVGPCRKQLKVAVPGPAVEAETQRVVAEYARKAKLPGFRKGKVPTSLIRRRYQKDIEKEVVERLLPRYWRQAQAESSLDPLLPPEVADVELAPAGDSLTFVATVETRPEIELRNYRDFDLPDPGVEPTPADVEQTLEEMRRSLGTWKEVERPAARGDLAVAEVGELPEGTEAAADPRPVEVELGDPRVWEELTLALTGLGAGQATEFERREGGEGEEPSRTRRFTARVAAVKERELPPLDDAFAARMGDFATVADLTAAVQRQLRANKQEERRRRREQAVLEQLRERHPLALPQGVVGHEVEHLLSEYAESLARRGVDVERAEINWQGLASEVRPQAERRVHARLLLDAISESEGIGVGEDEFERTLASIARADRRSTVAVRQSLDEAGKLESLRAQLRREKTIRHLLGEAVEPPAGEDVAQPG